METLNDYLFVPLENAFVKVGIKTAPQAGLVVAVGTAGLLYVLKPSTMFDKASGKPKQWSLFADAVNPTPVPWWLASAAVGWGFSLVI